MFPPGYFWPEECVEKKSLWSRNWYIVPVCAIVITICTLAATFSIRVYANNGWTYKTEGLPYISDTGKEHEGYPILCAGLVVVSLLYACTIFLMARRWDSIGCDPNTLFAWYEFSGYLASVFLILLGVINLHINKELHLIFAALFFVAGLVQLLLATEYNVSKGTLRCKAIIALLGVMCVVAYVMVQVVASTEPGSVDDFTTPRGNIEMLGGPIIQYTFVFLFICVCSVYAYELSSPWNRFYPGMFQ